MDRTSLRTGGKFAGKFLAKRFLGNTLNQVQKCNPVKVNRCRQTDKCTDTDRHTDKRRQTGFSVLVVDFCWILWTFSCIKFCTFLSRIYANVGQWTAG